jgi:hypothetical protein
MIWKPFLVGIVGKQFSTKRSTFMSNFAINNPFLGPWSTPFKVPPFAEIRPEHFEPAFDVSFKKHIEEITAIANKEEPPTFQNT